MALNRQFQDIINKYDYYVFLNFDFNPPVRAAMFV